MILTRISMVTGTCLGRAEAAAAGKATRGKRPKSWTTPQSGTREAVGSGSSASSPLPGATRWHCSTGSSCTSTRARDKVQRWESVKGQTDRKTVRQTDSCSACSQYELCPVCPSHLLYVHPLSLSSGWLLKDLLPASILTCLLFMECTGGKNQHEEMERPFSLYTSCFLSERSLQQVGMRAVSYWGWPRNFLHRHTHTRALERREADGTW